MGEYFQDGSWIGSPTDGGSSEGGSVGQVSGLVPSEEPSLRISQLVRDGAILKTVGRLLEDFSSTFLYFFFSENVHRLPQAAG